MLMSYPGATIYNDHLRYTVYPACLFKHTFYVIFGKHRNILFRIVGTKQLRDWTNAGLMLAHRLRRWPTLNQHWWCVVCSVRFCLTSRDVIWGRLREVNLSVEIPGRWNMPLLNIPTHWQALSNKMTYITNRWLVQIQISANQIEVNPFNNTILVLTLSITATL